MITISACLIVKNEAKVLERCLKSIQPIVDEIILVDTGSTDETKEIASRYTNQIYDFEWVDDFSKARNYSFSKATMDYIYVADADEIIDEENQKKFLQLKEVMLPEIEIVQMYYSNQLEYNTTYNFDKEYRPKLYKRIRNFIWKDPLHESVRLDPVIYDSEIVITHKPLCNHANRDFATFQKILKRNEPLSDKLIEMYARELFIAGKDSDFIEAYPYFLSLLEHETLQERLLRQCQCVLVRAARLMNNDQIFFKTCLKNIALKPSSAEVCCELGEYYLALKDGKEASIWFYNAAYETEPELSNRYGGDVPLIGLSKCFAMIGNYEQAKEYETLAISWCNENLKRA